MAAAITAAIGAGLRAPNSPTTGEAAAPNKNCPPPSSAEVAPGALRPRCCAMVITAGKNTPNAVSDTRRQVHVSTIGLPTATDTDTSNTGPVNAVAALAHSNISGDRRWTSRP